MLKFVVKRPVAVSMFYGALLLLGLISLDRLKVSLFPDIVFPRLTVLTPYPNVAPDEIENLITRAIEDAVSSVNGVRKIESRSQEGLSIVRVELAWGTSLDQAVINIRQKVDLIRAVLPQDSGKSIIVKFDPATDPIITLIARPISLEHEQMRDYIEKNVRPYMERINGVATLSILGGRRREIQINVDSRKMYGHGLSIDQIAAHLAASNFNFPAGNVRRGDSEYTVRIQGQFMSVKEIKNTVVSVSEAGVPVYLHQVASVVDGFREQKGMALYNGTRTVIIGLKKEPGKNTIKTAENIKIALVEINKRFARDIQFTLIQDQSRYIKGAIASVRNAALLGGVIAFFILFVFLGDLRAAVIIVFCIPVAVLSTFVLMYTRGLSINIMSLGGLAMGVGMLVDNAIVVLESIQNEKEKHPNISRTEAAIAGTCRVAGSVTASTLTSVVVFIPIIFVSGIAGEVFRDLALTVSFSLLSSLICSLSLIPMLTSLATVKGGGIEGFIAAVNKKARPLFQIAESFINYIRIKYAVVIRRCLNRPGPVLLTACGVTIIGGLLFWPVPLALFPEVDQGIVEAEIELPGGASLEESEEWHKRIHGLLTKKQLTKHTITFIGFDENDMESMVKGARKGNYSTGVYYIDTGKQSSANFIAGMEKSLSGAAIKKSFKIKGDALQQLLGESGNYYIIEVAGQKRQKAREIADWLRQNLEQKKEIRSVRSSTSDRDPELSVHLDREKIAAYGLSPETVARVIQTAFNGRIASVYREGDREIDIRIRLQKQDRLYAEQIKRIYIKAAAGGMTELGDMIKPEMGRSYSTILRRNQRRIEQLLVGFDPENEAKVARVIENLKKQAIRKYGESGAAQFEISSGKQNEETIRSLSSLIYAFLLSSILIYQLLAGQFESLLHPFTLALSIPLMLAGVSVALLITGHSLNISSAIGMIMLVGIVVNSAILLYECIQENCKAALQKGKSVDLCEILMKSGQQRIRPIMLTTLTTLLGLLPMAIGLGEGGNLQAPMAVVVIGGLTVSSLLTLVTFPTLYLVFERIKERLV